jgi:diadenosine tetraphosphate (Ap4A) HIT family hydrolase
MTEFALAPRLSADTAFIADWGLSRLLLMNDCRFLWLILVPRRAGMTELHDLGPLDRGLLVEELARATATLKAMTGAPKINIGSLGNLVAQLHFHIVARNPDDPAWPGPVWGHGHPIRYEASALHDLLARLAARLA